MGALLNLWDLWCLCPTRSTVGAPHSRPVQHNLSQLLAVLRVLCHSCSCLDRRLIDPLLRNCWACNSLG